MRNIFCATFAIFASEAAAIEHTKGDIRPQSPYVERTPFGDSLNFDLWVANPTEKPLHLGAIEIAYLDANGAELYARTLDYLGRGIDTIPDRTLAPKAERLFYNPFPVLPPDIDAKQVRARVTLYEPFERGREPEAVLVQEAVAAIKERNSPAMILPMRGRVLVWDGHDLHSHHRRWDYSNPGLRSFGIVGNAGRYSYDFVIVNQANEMKADGDESNESFFSFGAPVYAPRAGIIVDAEGGKADDKTFNPEDAKSNANTSFGNYAVIDHGDGLFSVLGHFRQNTLRVKVGDRVKAGQQIANAGASGSSLFAHLHYQLMDGQNIATAEGVPSYFKNLVRLRGSKRVRIVGESIDSGDIVETRR